jgi:NAD+ kinase
MKVKLIGKNLDDVIPLLQNKGFEIVDENPELLVAHGGDGALLTAEREFPGVPKLPLRDSRTAPLCEEHVYEKQINDFCSGITSRTEMIKLEGCYQEKSILGLNDIFIHNSERVSALRYRVWIDDELYANEIVGDGVGMATVHGSTAYYRSITHSVFRVGIGLAFSNSTEVVNHLVLPESSEVRIQIVRGPALMVADNSREGIVIKEGDDVIIRKAEGKACIYGVENFMCQKCRLLRHPNKYPIEKNFSFKNKNSLK